MSSVSSILTGNTSTNNATTQTQADQARTALASNFDTFLKLLTAQLQNQDPLSPMDSSKFTEQLVQYSQVEQQIQTNSQLSTLSDSLTKQIQATSAGAALAYIGKTAQFNSDAGTNNNAGGVNWDYALASTAANVKLTVTDDKGNTIYQTDGDQSSGVHSFAWNGKTSQGDAAPDGVYHLTVAATDSSGNAIDSAISITEQITGVDLSGSDAAVTTASGSRAFTSILRVTD